MDAEYEAELVAWALRGETKAAPFLVSLYGERLLGYARAHAPELSDTDRELICQRAIEAGVRAISKFDPSKGTLLSWFRGQVRFQTLQWRRETPAFGQMPAEIEQPRPVVPLDKKRVAALSRAVQSLSHDDQLILALRAAEQLAFSEIGQRLEITATAARQRYHRAVRRLSQAAEAEPLLALQGTGRSAKEAE